MKFATIVKCGTVLCTYVVVVAASMATDTAFAQEPLAIGPGYPRYDAVHDCSVEEQKWTDKDWETTKAARYGACMSNHGQVQ